MGLPAIIEYANCRGQMNGVSCGSGRPILKTTRVTSDLTAVKKPVRGGPSNPASSSICCQQKSPVRRRRVLPEIPKDKERE